MATFLSKHLSMVKPLVQKLLTNQTQDMVCTGATTFSKANAENTELPSRSFDLVTVMYAFHEAPKQGREKILMEAHRLLQPGGTLAVIDICTSYVPSKSMLAGEPYGKFPGDHLKHTSIFSHASYLFVQFSNTSKTSTSSFALFEDLRR